jgi:hypothetical protein
LTTDSAGEYNAPNLIPGTYTVRIEVKGFKTLDRQNVALVVGSEVRVDLTPQTGDQAQTVTVTEAIQLVDAASATLGGTLGNIAGADYQKASTTIVLGWARACKFSRAARRDPDQQQLA